MPSTALPSLDDTIPVLDRVANEFRTNGHTLIRDILQPEEVASWRQAIRDAANAYNTEKRRMEDRDTYGKAFLQVMNLWEVDEGAKAFVLGKRFAAIAARLLGVEKVRLYHDQALYKEAGGGIAPWHQDQYYWPLSTEKTVTMWMPLMDITEEMGMLTFSSGSHKEGRVGNIAISDASEEMLEDHIKRKCYPVHREHAMGAGDATFHYGWTLHSAPGNQSDQTREVMTIIYFADGATVTKPINTHQENDRQRWLQGLQPGSLAASSLNPLLP